MLTKSFAVANALLLLKEAQSLTVNDSPRGIAVTADVMRPYNAYDPYLYYPPHGMGDGEDRSLVEYDYSSL